MIKAVFSDIDGCIGKFVKPRYPLKQDLNGNLRNLRLIKDKTEEFKDIMFGVATGRSYYHSDNIMEQSGHVGASVFEMGNVLFQPERGIYNLFEEHPKFGLEEVKKINEFIFWRNFMESKEEEIRGMFPDSDVRQMKDRTSMLTYEFGRNVGRKLYAEIKRHMPASVKQSLREKILIVLFCDIAIDILPNLNKGEAIDYLIKQYGYDHREILGIGDSSHSDLDLLRGLGYIACPNNSDELLKQFVESRNGFVAEGEYSSGLLEILNNIHLINKNGRLH